ncbi:unnamed protein product [Closterium sp. Naga37s-1]|nr:unnamed protein product [Closterium sp. Naga37s-1]CAI5993074.1 unnamed protein product [Closterium sp. NIES-65]
MCRLSSVGRIAALACVLLSASLLAAPTHSFYLPGMYPKAHAPNSVINVKVNSLTSNETGLPFNFYSLPFCRPEEGIQKLDENFGEVLVGDMIENSPYKFNMLVTQRAVKVCDSGPLNESDVEHFKMRIDDHYHINLLLDNLPVTLYALEENPGDILTGFPIGYVSNGQYYIYNHILFKVLVHEYKETPAGLAGMSIGDSTLDVLPEEGLPEGKGNSGFLVVGFESAACSIRRVPDQSKPRYTALDPVDCFKTDPQPIAPGETIVFTFDVLWEKSDIQWASRWDAYLKMRSDQVHWFSILNSLMVISFLAGMVFVILLRSVHRDLAKIEQLDKEEAQQLADESGWKLVVGDVFRTPNYPGILCVVVANGTQLIAMATVTIFFAALGFMSPASRGALLMGMVFLYLLLGAAAGYVAARLWVTLTGLTEGAVVLAFKVACFFPGICAVVLTLVNFLLWGTDSTGAVPLTLYFYLFFIWFVISVPLTIAGTRAGFRADRLQYPVRTNQIPRQIPEQSYSPWLLIIGGGILPFGTLYIELFFIMSSMWMQRIYYGFGFLFIVLVLLIVVCAEVAVVFTYLQLTMEDYRWWWRSFFASGAVAFYVFLYSINYLIVDLHRMHGTLSAIIFMCYSVLMTLAIFLATGATQARFKATIQSQRRLAQDLLQH